MIDTRLLHRLSVQSEHTAEIASAKSRLSHSPQRHLFGSAASLIGHHSAFSSSIHSHPILKYSTFGEGLVSATHTQATKYSLGWLSQRRARGTERLSEQYTGSEREALFQHKVADMSSTLSSSQLLPQSPFDPYTDHFDPQRNGGRDHPESWSSGGNNSNSPLGQSNNIHDVDDNGDMSMLGMRGDEGSTVREPKRKRFVCPHCTRTFARSGHLQRHERSRTLLCVCEV